MNVPYLLFCGLTMPLYRTYFKFRKYRLPNAQMQPLKGPLRYLSEQALFIDFQTQTVSP
jgi:hypothetical protein